MTDYSFYTDNYLLGRKAVIDAASFPFWERKASQTVRILTYGNINESEPISENVQLCVCELAEALYRQDKADGASGKKIASEHVGGHSVTYHMETDAEKMMEIYNIIQTWLADTGLMYAGVSPC